MLLNRWFINFSKNTKGVFLSWVGFMILWLLDLITANTLYNQLVRYAYYFSVVLLGYWVLRLKISFERFELALEKEAKASQNTNSKPVNSKTNKNNKTTSGKRKVVVKKAKK